MTYTQAFQLLHISLLREYLVLDIFNQTFDPFGNQNLGSEGQIGFNSERLIDDFILLCALAGNDFLPHIPISDLGNDGLNILIEAYSEYLKVSRQVSLEKLSR